MPPQHETALRLHRSLRRAVAGFLRLFGILLIGAVLLIGLRYLWLQQTPRPTYQSVTALADPDGAFATINGTQVYYRVRGPATGPVIVLVHGFLLETASFETLSASLAEQGYRVLMLDRPPFGLSDKRPDLDYSTAAQADLIIGLLDQLGMQRATLLGHSAGGITVTNLALRYPERVERLILVGSAFRIPTAAGSSAETSANPGASAVLMVLAQGANPLAPWAEAELRSFFTEQQFQVFGRATYASPELVAPQQIAKLARMRQVQGWEVGLRAFGKQMVREQPITTDILATLRVPAMLIWGDQDRFVPLAIGQAATAAIPNARLLVYPACGHIPWEGCINTFVADLGSFVNE